MKKKASIYSGWTDKKGIYHEKAPAGVVLLRLLGLAPFSNGNRKSGSTKSQSKR
ncbi:MAG: hypothetical protein QXN96_04170 [Candidatus Bathyarchaeia archaeon]